MSGFSSEKTIEQHDQQNQQSPDRDRPRHDGADGSAATGVAHASGSIGDAPTRRRTRLRQARDRKIVRAESRATTRPRLNTSARWQMRSTSSKSEEISSTAMPCFSDCCSR